MPSGGLGEAGGGGRFSVTTDVVDVAGHGEGRGQGVSRVVDVERGSKGPGRSTMPGGGPVQKPEAENYSPATLPGEPVGFVFGRKG